MLLESVFTGSTRLLLEKMIYVLIIIVIASVIAEMIATATMRFEKKAQISHNIISLINKIFTYFIAFVSLVLILQIFNFDILTFVASFGIVGLIIGILIIGILIIGRSSVRNRCFYCRCRFHNRYTDQTFHLDFIKSNGLRYKSVISIGAHAVISNIISGILIMFEKPFIIDDFVEITGFQGKVEDIKLRSTSIKTFDGRIITVPNSTFTSNAVINYSKTGGIQVKIPVSFKTDGYIEKALQIMSSVAKNTHGIRPYGIEVLVTGIMQNDPSWNVEAELRFWVDQVSDRDVIVSS